MGNEVKNFFRRQRLTPTRESAEQFDKTLPWKGTGFYMGAAWKIRDKNQEIVELPDRKASLRAIRERNF